MWKNARPQRAVAGGLPLAPGCSQNVGVEPAIRKRRSVLKPANLHNAQDTGERELILRCKRGDKQAFGELVQKYMKRAYFTALGFVGTHEGALDLSQEAFVRAYKAMGQFDVDKKFFTWFYRILKNLCLNFMRDKSRQARAFSEIGEMSVQGLPDGSQDTAALAERNETRELVWKALNALKPAEREIILLRDFQDMSYKQIAELLDCPVGTVMSRLYNARKALREKLERLMV